MDWLLVQGSGVRDGDRLFFGSTPVGSGRGRGRGAGAARPRRPRKPEPPPPPPRGRGPSTDPLQSTTPTPPPPHARARAHTRRKLTHPTPPPACLPARGRGHATAAAAGYREEFGGRATDAPARGRRPHVHAQEAVQGARAPMRVPLSASAAYMCAGVAWFFCCLLSLLANGVRDGLLLLGWQFNPFTYLPVGKNPHKIRFVLHLVLMGFLLGQKLYSTGIRAWIVTTHTCFVRLLEKPTDMWALSQISINITI